MKPLQSLKYLLLTTAFVVQPYRLETDLAGKLTFVASLAHAESGSGSEGDGGDDGDGGEGGDGDDGEGGDDGSDGDDGEGGDDGEDGDDGDDGEDGDEGADGEDDGDDAEALHATKAQKLANGARITFSDGTREEVRNGEFVRTGRNGAVLERRRARSSDLARLRALFGGKTPEPVQAPAGVKSRAVKATYRGRNIEILYSNGWREEISSERYRLIDQYGRVAASRRATNSDRNRLNRFRK